MRDLVGRAGLLRLLDTNRDSDPREGESSSSDDGAKTSASNFNLTSLLTD